MKLTPLITISLGLVLLAGNAGLRAADKHQDKPDKGGKQPANGASKPTHQPGSLRPSVSDPGNLPSNTPTRRDANNTKPTREASKPKATENPPPNNSTTSPKPNTGHTTPTGDAPKPIAGGNTSPNISTTSPKPNTGRTTPTGDAPKPIAGGTSPNNSTTSPKPNTGHTAPTGDAPKPIAGGNASPANSTTSPKPNTGHTAPTGDAPKPIAGGTSPNNSTTSPRPNTGHTAPTGDAPKPIAGGNTSPANSTASPKPNTGHTSPSPSTAPKPTQLQTRTTAAGEEKVTSSGIVRERSVRKPGGETHTEVLSPTGRTEKNVITKPDGTKQATTYDLGNRAKKVEVDKADGGRETTDIHYNRNGTERARETVRVDAKGTPVSKTVEVRNNLAIHNTVVNHNTTIVRNNVTVVKQTTVVRDYVPCRYGYVYRPVVVAPVVYTGWYDPYWYRPPVVVGGGYVAVSGRRFTYSWGWNTSDWYVYHRAYWAPYPVYTAPSYWVTDWMVAGYLADRYAVTVNLEQTRKELELARKEADDARAAAAKAKEETEVAEAKAAVAAAELRAAKAEDRARKAEESETRRQTMAGKPNPNATPLDAATKEAFNKQVEKTMVEKKEFADATAKGAKPALPDVTLALKDPEHIYPVSKTLSVLSAKDLNPAGNLTAGDLLKVEPGQEAALQNPNPTDLVIVRVMTSKGEEDEVTAGTLVKVSVNDLQDFDNEFRAKLDKGVELASQNMDQFKKGAQ